METISGRILNRMCTHTLQREWNKVWREIDSKNFAKSLDHQGINFKTSDRKTMNSKSLLIEIETLYREQRERHRRGTAVAAPAGRYQLDFSFKDLQVFQDVKNILIAFMETNMQLSPSDETGYKDFLDNFIPRFFLVNEPAVKESADEGSNGDSKVPNDIVMTDTENMNGSAASLPKPKSRASYSFYANTHFYVFFRLYQVCWLEEFLIYRSRCFMPVY